MIVLSGFAELSPIPQIVKVLLGPGAYNNLQARRFEMVLERRLNYRPLCLASHQTQARPSVSHLSAEPKSWRRYERLATDEPSHATGDACLFSVPQTLQEGWLAIARW